MRRGTSILTLALAGVLALLCSPVSAQEYSQQQSGGQVDVGIFYDSLAPQGDWVEMPDYGWAWTPRVDRGWRPYTRGQWVNTDDGWYWDSDERFGWATYHYGRWVNDRNYGWMWVPGNEWAPAWVSWRHGNGYTGWAPLPPRATWQNHVGLNIGGLDIDAFIGERDYSFVQDRSFVDRGVYQRVVPPAQNVTIINQTTNITNYTVVNQRVVNRGVEVTNVERAVGRAVPRERTVDAARADAPRHARAGEVAVYRPEVRAAAPDKRPAQGKSLVKGDAPPPALVARRKAIEQERQTKGNAPEVTAKDVQEKKANVAAQPPVPRVDPKAQQQEAQRQRAQAQQDAAKAQADKRATDAQQQAAARQKAQEQQKAASQAQADKRARDAQLATEQGQNAQKQRDQQLSDQQRSKQERDALAKAQADKRATDAQQAKPQPPRPDAKAQQQEAQQQRAQQQADQRAKQASDAKAQADKRAADAQQARTQQQNDQKQRNQQQVDQQAQAQQQQKANAQAQADKRAKDAEQVRAQQQDAQQQRNQQQTDQRAKAQEQQKANAQAQADKRAKDAQAAKDNSKDKGKKPKASPTPPPAGQPQ